MIRCVFAGAIAFGLCATASAQIVNGDFETGSLTPWAIGFTPNGATTVQTVEMFDIDGPAGPLGATNAAKFGVGNAAAPNQPNQGIEVTQSVPLTGGVAYTIQFDYAAIRLSATNNADGGQFAIIVDGVSIANVATGSTSSNNPHYGTLTTPFTPPASGNYVIGTRIGRNFTIPGDLFQYVDNFKLTGGPAPCYPDCNGDGALNLSDFGCFQTAFALGQPYADCNGDGVRNLSDFGCFQTKFALGCP